MNALAMEPMPLGGDTVAWYSHHNKNVWGIAAPEVMRQIQNERKNRQRIEGESPPLAAKIEAN